ncbi:MAG TPA: DUF4147 domain-containing protein, partial [Gemmatales bacterium]|nr:DUF4147 domain-containing protein [Gemmatales bacterium]
MHNMHDSARKQAEAIWRAGVRAVQPANCVPAALRPLAALTQGWQANKPYRVNGGGKAGAAMAQATESFLLSQGIPGENLEGWVNIPEGSAVAALQRIHLHPSRPAGYNFPTPAAVAGTEAMLKLIENAPWDAVILCLISGGGSAILSAPTVPLEDKLTISRMLTAAGANMAELVVLMIAE